MKCDDPIRDRSRSHSRPVDRLRTVLPARSGEWLSQAHGRTSAEFAQCPSSVVALQWFSDRPAWVRRARKYTCRTEYPVLSFGFWVLSFGFCVKTRAQIGSRRIRCDLTQAKLKTQNARLKTQN